MPHDVSQNEIPRTQRMGTSSGVLKNAARIGLVTHTNPAIRRPKQQLTQNKLDKNVLEIVGRWMMALPVPRSLKFRMNTIKMFAIAITP
jgi:hypothetical protein